MRNYKFKAMLLLAVLLSSVSAFAGDLWLNDVEYTLNDDGTAQVNRADEDIKTAVIPEKITYEGKDYTVTSIRGYAFRGRSSLTSVTIPNSVTSIGMWAFNGCSYLTSVTIPNSVTSIGKSAFWDCSSLASVTIPNSVTSIGDDAFYGCKKLFAYHYKKDGTATLLIAGYESDEIYGKETYNIPEKVTRNGKDYTVTSIGDYAFSDCSSLTSVTIPNSVTSIGDGAFSDCSSLASVTIPNSVTSIGDYAFSDCSSLTSVTIPNSVTSIGESAFSGCSRLFAYHYKKDGTATLFIAGYESDEIYSKKTYSIPEKVTHDGKEYSVTGIGDGAFWNCKSLTSVIIPSSVTSIGNGAFTDCLNLASIIIPNSVTSIGNAAFYKCGRLRKVVSMAITPPVCGWEAFYGIDKRWCTLYVPEESVSAYKSAAQWKEFYKIETGIKNVSTSALATEAARYSTDGTCIALPKKGINIIRMSDGTVKKVLVK